MCLLALKFFQDREDSKTAREALGPQAAVAQYYHEIMLIESFESLLTRGHAMQGCCGTLRRRSMMYARGVAR